MKGFDISYWQGKLSKANFVKAKLAGFDFVILRVGYNKELKADSTFEDNYKGAKAAGLIIGAYYYSTAKTVAQSKKEAEFCLKILNGRELSYPIFIDFEDPSQANLGKDLSKKICEAFCNVITKAGYSAGVYASYNYLTNKIAKIDDKYTVWLAQYPKATYKGRYELHQYSSTTAVPGIGNRIDVDTSILSSGKDPKTIYPTLPKRGYFQKGDKGVNVKRMQTALNKVGYSCGTADGIFGDRTLSGVKTFQYNNGLAVDGLFGKKSLKKLKEL